MSKLVHITQTELLKALLDAHKLIEYAKDNGAYVNRGGDHYIETSNVHRAICEALGLDYKTVSTEIFNKAIAKARGEL